MSRFISTLKKNRMPPRHTESKHTQYGKAQKGAAICKQCMHISYRKEWLHPRFASKKALDEAGKSNNFTLCPACFMLENHLYEGEIIINQVPLKFQQELVNLVNAYGKRALFKDSQHRILNVEKNGPSYRVTTTENQLAGRLAKKIKEVFRNIELHISHSKEPYAVERAVLRFA